AWSAPPLSARQKAHNADQAKMVQDAIRQGEANLGMRSTTATPTQPGQSTQVPEWLGAPSRERAQKIDAYLDTLDEEDRPGAIEQLRQNTQLHDWAQYSKYGKVAGPAQQQDLAGLTGVSPRAKPNPMQDRKDYWLWTRSMMAKEKAIDQRAARDEVLGFALHESEAWGVPPEEQAKVNEVKGLLRDNRISPASAREMIDKLLRPYTSGTHIQAQQRRLQDEQEEQQKERKRQGEEAEKGRLVERKTRLDRTAGVVASRLTVAEKELAGLQKDVQAKQKALVGINPIQRKGTEKDTADGLEGEITDLQKKAKEKSGEIDRLRGLRERIVLSHDRPEDVQDELFGEIDQLTGYEAPVDTESRDQFITPEQWAAAATPREVEPADRPPTSFEMEPTGEEGTT
ncbi:hypothetical protein LCGC14_2843250, partial [marine sediment metagenome]